MDAGRRCSALGLLLGLLLAGCDGSHLFVDKVKSQSEQSQQAMRAMNSYEQAKQCYLSGDLDQALHHINDSVSCKADVSEALLLRLQILIDMNQGAMEVLKAAEAGAKVAPKEARFAYYTGIFYERGGQPIPALTCYKKAARIDPSSVQYKLAAAELMIEQKNFLEAEEYLHSAVRHHPNAPGLLQTLGALAQIRGNNAKAVRYFSEALALAPTAQPIQENMAKACFSVGEYFKALQHLEPLLDEPGMEDRRDLQSLAAQCYLKCNRPMEARRILQKLIKEPGEATFSQLRMLADGAVLLADWPLLKTAANRMISLKPNAAPGYLALAVFFENEGNRAAAWQTLEEYRKLSDGNVSALVDKYQASLK